MSSPTPITEYGKDKEIPIPQEVIDFLNQTAHTDDETDRLKEAVMANAELSPLQKSVAVSALNSYKVESKFQAEIAKLEPVALAEFDDHFVKEELQHELDHMPLLIGLLGDSFDQLFLGDGRHLDFSPIKKAKPSSHRDRTDSAPAKPVRCHAFRSKYDFNSSPGQI